MDKCAKQILNSLKCPICDGQLDLIDIPISKKGHNFSCVVEPIHYSIFFVHWDVPYRIEKETVMLYEGRYLYEIVQEYTTFGIIVNRTEILIREIDLEKRIIDNGKFKTFRYDKPLFDFSKIKREKIVNRIKTILVFQ